MAGNSDYSLGRKDDPSDSHSPDSSVEPEATTDEIAVVDDTADAVDAEATTEDDGTSSDSAEAGEPESPIVEPAKDTPEPVDALASDEVGETEVTETSEPIEAGTSGAVEAPEDIEAGELDETEPETATAEESPEVEETPEAEVADSEAEAKVEAPESADAASEAPAESTEPTDTVSENDGAEPTETESADAETVAGASAAAGATPVASEEQSETAAPAATTSEAQDSSDDKREPASGTVMRLALAGWGVAAACLVGIAGFGIYSGTQTTVPQAAVQYDATDEDADKTVCEPFQDADLKCDSVVMKSYDVPAGGFISQTVKAGDRVSKDSTVQIVYSAGPQFGEMPKVKGVSLDQAKSLLAQQSLAVGETKTVDNSGLPKGSVVSTSIREGAVTDNGDTVNLTISSGKTVAEDFSGMSADQAKKQAADDGLDAKINWVVTGAPYGVVNDQSVKAGDTIDDGQITLNVSKPAEGVALQIPDVVGANQDDGLSELYKSGITMLNIVEVEGDKNTIVAVSPSESQYVSSSQVVTVVVETTDKD